MPGFWIRVNARLADDHLVRSFARALFPTTPVWLSVHTACGLLVTLWGRVIDEQEDGRLADRDDDVLEEWAKWRGDPGAFAALVRGTFLDPAGVILEWDTYAGPLIRRRERDRNRKRGETGEAPLADDSFPRGGRAEFITGRAEGHAEVRAEGAPSSSGNGNGHDHQETATAATAAELRAFRPDMGAPGLLTATGRTARDLLVAKLGADIAAVEDFVASRPQESWSRWFVEMLKIVGPATGIEPGDLAEACPHALLAEPPVTNPAALGAFARNRRNARRRGDAAGALPNAGVARGGARTGVRRAAAAQYDPSANGAALRRLDREGVTDGDPS